MRVTTDRRGFTGGQVTQCVGPWKTSGAWWQAAVGSQQSAVKAGLTTVDCRLSTEWDREEWDVALNDGAVYRIFQARTAGGWFIDAIAD